MAEKMKIGIAFHATDLAMHPVELAKEAEARGFDSIYFPEHTHIPACRRTPLPTGEMALDEEYYRSPDPYILLAGAATVTTTIRLGTGVSLPAQHDPITLAKEIASLDWLSRGRLVLGIGFGWNVEEMENHGINTKKRRKQVREYMLAMQALWNQEVASFCGEFVNFEPSYQWPKPVQRPRPRTLIGAAASPTVFEHIAEYADGWFPVGGAGLKDALVALRRAMEARGRDPRSLHIAPMGVIPDRGKLDYYTSLGVTETVLRVPSAPRERVLRVLDDYAQYL